MIIWLASYPKSGNTLLRSMLSAFFFSNDGNFNFDLLNNIKQFPDNSLFQNLDIDISNQNEVVQNYIRSQEEINRRDNKSIRFLKTHSALNDINNYKFTDLKNTLGVIYIVRDPRQVVRSYANHSTITLEDAKKRILEIRTIGGPTDPLNKTVIHTGSWSSNYNSWKEFKKVKRYFLVKYEELTSNPEQIFIEVLKFLHNLANSKLIIDQDKLKNILKTTSFEHLQSLEKQEKFLESPTAPGEKYVNFFKYGNKKSNDEIPTNIKEELEINLKKDMEELGYL